jgi:PKD repeat protein
MQTPDSPPGETAVAVTPWLTRLARAFGASLLLFVLAGATTVAAADIGHQDFADPGGNEITGSKPESKLWYNDGFWWASMSSGAEFHIYKLNPATDQWTATPTVLDNRPATRADTLWDGTHLYVASQRWEDDGGGTGSGANNEARLYRFIYNATTDTYTPDGVPVVMRAGIRSETLVIAKDSTGTLWATWTLETGGTNRVYTNHTIGGVDTVWSAPAVLPVGAEASTDEDDISSIIAFTVAGQHRVGVFWSNQADNKDYFAWHVDGASDATWTEETALAAVSGDPAPADDHMNLKTDSSGTVYAVVKTSNVGGGQPQEELLVRSPGGAWDTNLVATVSNSPTRAILELDDAAHVLHVFMTGPHNGSGDSLGGGDIYEKTASTSSILFPSGVGTPVIRDGDSSGMNDATSTKQNVNATTGIVVLAFNNSTKFYWHHQEGGTPSDPPDAQFTGTPTSGQFPLLVTFTNTSTGTAPLTYAWNFGDPASGASNTSTAKNPTHTYGAAGDYDVSLTVTNTAGNDVRTRTDYIHVTAPPPPVAAFSGSPRTGTSPLAVTFRNASTGIAPLTYAWNFGDPGSGSSNTSAAKDPVHTYNPGTYTVTLKVSNIGGSDTETKTGYVVVSPPPGSRFSSISPTRVLDTRSNIGLAGAFHANVGRDFVVADGTPIPTNAVAVTGNLTITKQSAAGYVVLAPSAGGSTSTINFPKGDTRANGVTVALGAGGKLNAVYKAKAGATTQIVFDVTGYFTTSSNGARFHSIAPTRVLDNRINLGLSGSFHANTPRTFTVADGTPIPTNAVAVTGNLTVTGQTKAGYIVLAPAAGGSTSTLNFPVGDNRANGVTVPLGAGGTLSASYVATAGATTSIVFDVTGYFQAGSTGASYFVLAPQRSLDTRINLGLSGAFHVNTARDFTVADGTPVPTNAVAVTGNLTVTGQTKAGYIVLAPAAGGSTSTLNFPKGDNRANGVTVALGAGGKLNAVYKAKAGATTHLVFDVTGYFR